MTLGYSQSSTSFSSFLSQVFIFGPDISFREQVQPVVECSHKDEMSRASVDAGSLLTSEFTSFLLFLPIRHATKASGTRRVEKNNILFEKLHRLEESLRHVLGSGMPLFS